MLVLRSEIPAVRRDDLETGCELLWVEITTASSSILLGAFYCPPGTGSVPLNQLHQSLSSIPDSRHIILCGDFNLPGREIESLSDLILNRCLSQLVQQPTQ